MMEAERSGFTRRYDDSRGIQRWWPRARSWVEQGGAGAWQAARHESVGISSMFMAMPVKKQGEKHQDRVGSQFLVCR